MDIEPRRFGQLPQLSVLLAAALAASLPAPVAAAAEESAGSGIPGDPAPESAPSEEVAEAEPPSLGATVRGRRPLSRDRSADTLEIEGDELRASVSPSLLEAIGRESADVYVSSRGLLHGVASGASGGIQIRGLGGSPNAQILVVEDGVPDYQGIFGHPLPDAYQPFLIDRVLLIKGGDSVLYGTNALGGVIVIESRWRDEEGFELQSDTGFGSFATVRQSAGLLARRGRLQLSAGFSTLQTQGHREGAGGGATVGSLALRHQLTPRLRLGVRNKLVHLEGADPGPITHPTPANRYEVLRDNLGLELLHHSPGQRLRLSPYLSVGVHRLHDGFRSTDVVLGAVAEGQWRLAPPLSLLAGAAVEGVDGEVEDRVDGGLPELEGQLTSSAYSQLSFRPLRGLSLVGGGRALHSSRYGWVPLFKFGGRYELESGLYLHGRVTRNFRQPTLRELYLPFPTANPKLRPERATNWDLGLGYEGSRFEVSITAYLSDVKDLIRTFGAWPTADVLNIDRALIPGVEGRVAIAGPGLLSLTLLGDVQRVGRYTRQNPSAKAGFALDYGRLDGAGVATLNAEWVGGLYMANYGRQPLDDVFVADLSLRRSFRLKGQGVALEPYLLLRNFIDRDYEYIAGYRMPGIHALAGLRIHFDAPTQRHHPRG